MLDIFYTSSQNYSLFTALQVMLPIGLITGILGGLSILNRNNVVSDYAINGALITALLTYMLFNIEITPFVFLFTFAGALISMVIIRIMQYSQYISPNINKPLLSSLFFGVAMLLLKMIEMKYDNLGLELTSIIFGNASAMLQNEVEIAMYISLISVVLILLAFTPIKIIMTDFDFAKSVGISITFYTVLIVVIYTSVVSASIQAIGALFFIPILILPAISAKMLTTKSSSLVILSGLFGVISALVGSLIAGNSDFIMTGQSTVISAFVIMIISMILSKIFVRKPKNSGGSKRV